MTILSEQLASLDTDLDTIYDLVDQMIDRVVDQLQLESSDQTHSLIAAELKQNDKQIDELDVNIEDRCLQMLALQQPVATDLRRLIFATRVIGHLERIGDLCVSMSECLASSRHNESEPLPGQIHAMAEGARAMFRDVTAAYQNSDAAVARRVRKDDERIDTFDYELTQSLIEAMRKENANLESLLNQTTLSRKLERLADHIVMIGEEIVFLVNGEIVRHQIA